MLTRCDGCGVESPLAESFKKHGSAGGKVQTLCPRCLNIRARRGVRVALAFCAGTMGLLVLVCLFSNDRDRQGFYYNISLIPAFLMSLTVHEFGHALATRLVGIKVWRITLGAGRQWARWRLLGFPCELHELLISGQVSMSTLGPRFTPGRRIFVMASGPAANFLFAGLVMAGLPYVGAGCRAFALACLVVNVGLGVANLIPFQSKIGGSVKNSDGRQIYRLLRFGDEGGPVTRVAGSADQDSECLKAGWSLQKADGIPLPFLLWTARLTNEALSALRAHDYEIAREAVNQGLAFAPQQLDLLEVRNLIEVKTKNLEVVQAHLTTYGAREDLSPLRRGFNDNNMAYALALGGEAKDLPQADTMAAQAFAVLPWNINIRATRGFVWAMLGRFEDGEKLLREACAEDGDFNSQATKLCLLAYAVFRQGRHEEAAALMRRARRRDPQCELLTWLKQLGL